MSLISNQRKGQQFSISGQTLTQVNNWVYDKIANENMSITTGMQIVKGFKAQELLG